MTTLPKRLLFLFLGVLPGLLPASGSAAPHPFSFDDLARLGRVADPQLSADGKTMYYAVARTRLELNRWQSAIYVQQGSGPPQRLTTPERGPRQEGGDTQPHLSPDGRWLAFLSTRDNPTPQLYLLRLGGGESRRLTDLPAGVHAIYWSPDSRAIVIQTRVFPQCPPYSAGDDCNKRRMDARDLSPIKARLIDRLLYRWWDSWNDGQRSHLYRVLLGNETRQDNGFSRYEDTSV